MAWQESKDHVPDIECSYAPLDDECSHNQDKTTWPGCNHPVISKSHAFVGTAYLILALLYVILWMRLSELPSTTCAVQHGLFPSLAQSSAFHKQSRVFSLTTAGTPFAGDPSPEVDQAWHELLQGTTIQVAGEDLDYYNITSLPLANGSGFASQLFVTHELHCLKKVRQWIYKDAYFTDVQGVKRNELKRHVDHCIETLRQGIMCRGDTSLATFSYLGDTRNVTARSWASHQCVDFEALMAWTRERVIDIMDQGVLVEPGDLGPEHFTAVKQPH